MNEISELIDRLESMPPGQERDRLRRFITEWMTDDARANVHAMLEANEAAQQQIVALTQLTALFSASPRL